jgi:hypothetical protein
VEVSAVPSAGKSGRQQGIALDSAENRRPWPGIGLLFVLALLYAAYFELRYSGLWIENDTAVFTGTTTAMLRAGSVLFNGQYPHGFGYPAWLGVLSLETGLAPAVVNGLIAPFFGTMAMTLAAALFYRRLLRSDGAATVAVLMLFLVPDLMFTVLRGNHEKLNVPFIMLAVYSVIWFVDAQKAGDLKTMTVAVVLYYVSVFVNGVTNDYFGVLLSLAGFLTALLLTLFRNRSWTRESTREYVRRFRLSAFLTGLLMLWVMVFLFPRSDGDVSLLQTLIVKLKSLLSSQRVADNPYQIASQQWVTPWVNEAFSLFHWSVILLSATALVYILRGVISRRLHVRAEEYVLLCVYVAFALLVAVAVPVDFVGLGAGTNLELRNYTYFTLFAVPVIVTGIGVLRSSIHPPSIGGVIKVAGLGVIAILFVAALLKSTVDPLVSNSWMMYTPSEREAIAVFHKHSSDTALWAGGGDRLGYLYTALYPDSRSGDEVVGYAIRKSPFVTEILVSPIIRASVMARHEPMPSVRGYDEVFDNGGAQIFERPITDVFQY